MSILLLPWSIISSVAETPRSNSLAPVVTTSDPLNELWNWTFDPSPFPDGASAVVLGPTNDLYIGGTDEGSGDANSSDQWRIVRLDRGGSYLSNWSYNPSPSRDYLFSLAIDQEADLFAAGRVDIAEVPFWRVVKFDSSGTQIWNWTGGPWGHGARAISTDPLGSILVGGTANALGSSDFFWRIVKLTTDGTEVWNWTHNPSPMDDSLASICTDRYGNVYAGGFNRSGSGEGRMHVVKVLADGSTAWTWTNRTGSQSVDSVFDLVAGPSNELYVAGQTLPGQESLWRVVRLRTEDGSVEWDWMEEAANHQRWPPSSISQNSQGELLLAGSDELVMGDRQFKIVKLHKNGTRAWEWTNNPSPATDSLSDIAIDSTGAIYSGGVRGGPSGAWRVVKLIENLQAPVVLATIPPMGDPQAPVNTTISADFSLPMNQSSTQSAFAASPPIPGTFAWDPGGTRLTLTPLAPLTWSTQYAITFGNEAKSDAGVPLVGTRTFSFTTTAESVAPIVVSTSPGDGSKDVSLDARIKVLFDQDMEPAATAAAFSISPDGPGGAASVSANILEWNHSTPFDEYTSYTISISTGAVGVAGANLAEPYVFSFTTAERPPVPPAPVVIVTVPASGANDVPLNATISVTFSVPMEPASAKAAFSISPQVAGGIVRVVGDSLSWNAASHLQPRTKYVVTIAASATSIDGSKLGVDYVFEFTTETTPGTTGDPSEVPGLGVLVGILILGAASMTLVFFSMRKRKATKARQRHRPA